ncbi:MAG: DUF3987 domain-containing protein, partial [Bradyrhizobium sp.]|nr:DUF3987 domain-containing protein [Bradyrhizobium sp.]
PAKPQTTTHTYVDEAGTPLFDVVIERQPSGKKNVRQHAVRPDGSRARTLGAARRVLYRLPMVLRAVQATATVLVVEGEKCVEAVEGLGLVATTNPGGAGKWLPEYSKALRSADVVVLPDNDQPGRAHAAAVAAALDEIAHSVRVVDLPGLPEHGDVADWIAAGGTRADLLALIRPPAASAAVTSAPGVPVDTVTFPQPQLDPAARHGLFGQALDLLEPTTEAEPAAILGHLLVAVGAFCGPGPHLRVGNQKMPAKTFAVVVGASAKARKGTAWGDAATVLERVDPEFFTLRGQYVTGLSSGEGLIARLKDDDRDHLFALDDGAPRPVADPRLLVVEPEWGKVLRLNQRQGNTLSAIIRETWDTGPLQVLTRADPLRATHHHVGLLGHVTVDELVAELDSTSAANGFANRHLFLHVTRTKILPRPAQPDEARLGLLALGLRRAITAAQERREVFLSPGAQSMWDDLYRRMEEVPEPTGIAAHLLQRGPAQTLRLALIYALTNSAPVVDVEHLLAAHAVWRYAEASVLHIFGQRLGDPVAERLLKALRKAGPGGLTGREQHQALDGNATKEALGRAIALLIRLGLAEQRTVPAGPQGGRPSNVLLPTQVGR